LSRRARQGPATVRFLVAFTLFLALLFSGCGALVGAFKGLVLQRAAIGLAGGLLLGGLGTLVFWRAERRAARQTRVALAPAMMEDVEVQCEAATALDPVLGDADDPALCVDLGEGSLLLLRGQWLMDGAIFGPGEALAMGEEQADTFNALPEPYSFPRTEFRLTREPETGAVLAIALAGSYFEPLPARPGLRASFPLRDSDVIAGSLASLEEDLARHFRADGLGPET
jgi:hypothetical protein